MLEDYLDNFFKYDTKTDNWKVYRRAILGTC